MLSKWKKELLLHKQTNFDIYLFICLFSPSPTGCKYEIVYTQVRFIYGCYREYFMAPSARYGNLFQEKTETPSDEGARFPGAREEKISRSSLGRHVSFFVEVIYQK